MFKTVVLSDGQPCRVRVLGLFELDGKGRDIIGPYRYSILMATGQVLEDEYRLDLLTEIPKPPPAVGEVGSYEWHQQQEYDTYTAALAHEAKRLESYEGYAADIANYILTTCLEETDRQRVISPDDWRKIQTAAVVPQLTEEAVAETLRATFPGQIWGE